jgi:hypothetical protein
MKMLDPKKRPSSKQKSKKSSVNFGFIDPMQRDSNSSILGMLVIVHHYSNSKRGRISSKERQSSRP